MADELHPFDVEKRRRRDEQKLNEQREVIKQQQAAIETLLDALDADGANQVDCNAVRECLPDSLPDRANAVEETDAGLGPPWEREGMSKSEWLEQKRANE